VGDSVDDGGGLGGSGDDSGAGGALHRRLATFPLTDLGNAERFTARFAKSLRFCPALGWIEWSGTHWRRKGADEAVKRAEHTTVRAIQD
jgi:putative DNA primase/helicase